MAHILHAAPKAGIFRMTSNGILARLNDWNEARKTRNALSRLTRAELDDIGLVPGDIDRIAKRHF